MKNGEMIDESGSDKSILEALLDNSEADRVLSKAAIARATKDGMSRFEAERFYGLTTDTDRRTGDVRTSNGA